MPEGRRVTLALANLSRHCALTSTLWSCRQVTPLHKSGPRVVRSTLCLRPISISAVMTAVVDGLWTLRNAPLLEVYPGVAQQGGVGDPISPLLALLLHAQLRCAQGLSTYWAVTDLQWAFDVASHQAMLLNSYEAGVCGDDWLLLDDFMSSDSQFVALRGHVTALFSLEGGTAQGRKFSLRTFNAQLKWLADEVYRALPGGCAAWVEPHLRRHCLGVAVPGPSGSSGPAPPAVGGDLEALAIEVASAAAAEQAPFPRAERAIRNGAHRISSEADRAYLLDRLGSGPLPPLQFVDDLMVATSSPGALRAIVSQAPWSACSRYARRTRSLFNYKAGKTAAMAILGSPLAEDVGCPVVDTKVLLGVLFDSGLTFGPLLRATLARGHELFESLFFAGESGGFGLPVLCAQVPLRVDSAVLYPSPFLFLADRARFALDHMQASWARRLLGCAVGPQLPGAVVIAQCGWPMRLGTRMVERTILARARLFLLPGEHPGASMLAVASGTSCSSWASTVRAWMNSLDPPLPDVVAWPFAGPQACATARADPAARRLLLRSYKFYVVRPASLKLDRLAFERATADALLQWNLLDLALGPGSWLHFRLWAVVRMSGCWPLQVLGAPLCVPTLPRCGACGARDVDVWHALFSCPASAALRSSLWSRLPLPPPSSPGQVSQFLFHQSRPPAERREHVHFVAAAVLLAITGAAQQ